MQTLVEILRDRAVHDPSCRAVRYLAGDGYSAIDWSVADLDRAARAVAASLSDLAPGERALLLYPPGADFIAAFFGCLYARILPVPLPPPKPHRLERQGAKIASDCAAAAILTDTASADLVTRALARIARLPVRTTGHEPTAAGDAWNGPLPATDAPAFIQYTSGTTAGPKGVLLTHANLAANVRTIETAFRFISADRMVTWLPHFHDMGLIGTLVTPVMLGFPVILMSPLDMLRRPIRWLHAMSKYRATVTGSPPFGYERCLSRIRPEDRQGLDLSACRLAFVGAEPIRAGLLERFCAAYAAHGFDGDAFYPCYGMAEITLFATGGTAGGGFKRARSAPDTVSCGGPAQDHRLLIVDPDTRRPVDPGEEGEIWLSGPSVAAGYWGRAQESEAVFRARLADGDPAPFLRTGDLGRQEADGLVVTGRLKDVIIVAGRNHHAEDLERSVRTNCPELGGIAAFAVAGADGEALVLAVEGADSEALRARLREVMAAEHDLAIADLFFVPSGRLPRTTSGKISRTACRRLYRERGRTVDTAVPIEEAVAAN